MAMKKLTKKQRNECYKLAYERIEGGISICICGALCSSVLGDQYYITLIVDPFGFIENNFDELMLFCPTENKTTSEFWYSRDEIGKQERLTALGFMIAMTESLKQNKK